MRLIQRFSPMASVEDVLKYEEQIRILNQSFEHVVEVPPQVTL